MWSQTLRALARRWYLVLAGLLATAGLGAYVLLLVPPTFEASGSMLVLPSENQTEQSGNPFLELDRLSAPAEFVVARLNSDDTRASISAQVPTASYTVELDTASRGPVILVTASDETAEGAKTALDSVLVAIPEQLYSLQAGLGVPKVSAFSVMRLVVDPQATEVTNATTRALVAAVAAGLVATVAGTVMIDALIRRRRELRGSRATQPDPDPSSGAPVRNNRHRLRASARQFGILGSRNHRRTPDPKPQAVAQPVEPDSPRVVDHRPEATVGAGIKNTAPRTRRGARPRQPGRS